MAFSASQWRSESLLVDVDEMTGIHTPEPSEPIIDGVLRRGHILMLTGPPKAGKSWGMGHLAYAVATGTDWMGFRCHEGTVCYVDTELDPKSLFVRLDRIRSQLGLRDSHGNIMAMSLRGKAIDAETLVNTITDAYGDQPAALVIIDSIYSIETGDENNAGDMREMMMHGLRHHLCSHYWQCQGQRRNEERNRPRQRLGRVRSLRGRDGRPDARGARQGAARNARCEVRRSCRAHAHELCAA